jgi:hypothetical protein
MCDECNRALTGGTVQPCMTVSGLWTTVQDLGRTVHYRALPCQYRGRAVQYRCITVLYRVAVPCSTVQYRELVESFIVTFPSCLHETNHCPITAPPLKLTPMYCEY